MSKSGLVGMVTALLVLVAGSVACGGEPSRSVADQFRELVNRPAVLDEAENRLIGECMSRAGMPYPPVPAPRDERPTAGLLKGPAPLRLDDVRRHGYPDALMNPERGPDKGPVEVHTEALPPDTRDRFYRLLHGNGGNDVRVRPAENFEAAASSAGCVGSARHRLYGSVGNFLTVFYLPELAQRHVAGADDDQDVRAAYGAYAHCMTAEGYRAATPADAVTLARTYYPEGRRETAGSDEIGLAMADVGCRTVTRLHERHTAAVDRIVLRWLADNGTAVSDAHSLLQTALAEARTVMAR